jgi:hypothetical protein
MTEGGRTVPGFLPSATGLHFPNSFPHVPVRRIGIPGLISVPIGDASNGLCGGMAFAARDYFEAGRPPPGDIGPPAEGALFDYLVDRLFASFELPRGPLRYLELMNPALPDGETLLSRLGLGPRGRSWRMIREEWPRIRADIDAGHPSALGLVKVRSLDPFDLKYNHQVLAYGYRVTGGRLTLRLYDPNWPDRDDVTLSLGIVDPARPVSVTMSPTSDRPVIGFFRVGYRPALPP